MDPLSVTASVIAVVGIAAQTSKALRALYNLRNVPLEVLELANEVSDLQTLLSLVHRAIGDTALSSLSPDQGEFVKRLVDSARDPLGQLDDLIAACYSNTTASSAEQGRRSSVSFITWLRSRNAAEKVKNKFLRAQRNINTVLIALGGIYRQEDKRLIVNIHDLILTQSKETQVQRNTFTDESTLCNQFSRAILVEQKNQAVSQAGGTLPSYRELPIVAARSDPFDPLLLMPSPRTQWQASETRNCALDHHINGSNHFEPPASIRASISKGTCGWSCRCQCHPRRAAESPRWLTQLLGTLFYSHTGTPFLRLRPCDYSACVQRESASCQLTYHFPRWMIRRAFTLTASYRDLDGMSGSWSIGFPRTISASHQAWRYIQRGQSREFLQLLRQSAISVNDMADDDGTSLLTFALKQRSHEITSLLLDYHANPHLVDPRGISACAYAQSSLLIDQPLRRPPWLARMDITIDEPSVTDDLLFTPLHHVVIGLEQADLRQQLRMYKIDVNAPDSMGRSALHWATIKGNSAAVKTLLEHEASPSAVDREQMTPLHDLYLCPSTSQKLCAELLLNAGAKVDALDAWGRTPFRIAVSYANTSQELLRTLIDYGADINRTDIYSQSPVLKSIAGSNETTRLLLDHGADVEVRDCYGNNPVIDAIYQDKPDKLQMLLEHGAETDIEFELKPGRRAREGQASLLDLTVWYGSVEVMRVLERSPSRHYHLSRPVDPFEQFKAFRLANGRKAGKEEQQALGQMMSKILILVDPSRCLDSLRASHIEDMYDNDVFVDAHDTFSDEI